MQAWSYDGDSTLAEANVQSVVEDCGEGVPCEWSQKDQRDYCIGKVVVFFQIWN